MKRRCEDVRVHRSSSTAAHSSRLLPSLSQSSPNSSLSAAERHVVSLRFHAWRRSGSSSHSPKEESKHETNEKKKRKEKKKNFVLTKKSFWEEWRRSLLSPNKRWDGHRPLNDKVEWFKDMIRIGKQRTYEEIIIIMIMIIIIIIIIILIIIKWW